MTDWIIKEFLKANPWCMTEEQAIHQINLMTNQELLQWMEDYLMRDREIGGY